MLFIHHFLSYIITSSYINVASQWSTYSKSSLEESVSVVNFLRLVMPDSILFYYYI